MSGKMSVVLVSSTKESHWYYWTVYPVSQTSVVLVSSTKESHWYYWTVYPVSQGISLVLLDCVSSQSDVSSTRQ